MSDENERMRKKVMEFAEKYGLSHEVLLDFAHGKTASDLEDIQKVVESADVAIALMQKHGVTVDLDTLEERLKELRKKQ